MIHFSPFYLLSYNHYHDNKSTCWISKECVGIQKKAKFQQSILDFLSVGYTRLSALMELGGGGGGRGVTPIRNG